MRVRLTPEVLKADDVNPLALLAIIYQCRDPLRHFLVVDSSDVTQWLHGLSASTTDPTSIDVGSSMLSASHSPTKALHQWIGYVIEAGCSHGLGRGDKTFEIRVVPDASDWRAKNDENRASPKLLPEEALRLLQAPLQLLVEDKLTEAAFLRKMCQTTAKQDRFKEAERKGWIVFEHGAGGRIKEFLDDAKELPDTEASSWIRWIRLWVMFDRDAKENNCRVPSTQAFEKLKSLNLIRKKSQVDWPVGHMLERRTIENYLPHEALRKYAETQQDAERDLAAVVEAFCRKEFDSDKDERRAYYCMERGLEQFNASEQPPYALLNRDLKGSLAKGFGPKVKKLWSGGVPGCEVLDEWVSAESKHPKNQEISALIDDILERI